MALCLRGFRSKLNTTKQTTNSANRQRELNRLNQIERRRQILELQRQNDLFGQMSFTVNSTKIGADSDSIASASQQQATDSKCTQGANNCQTKRDNLTPPANGLHGQQVNKPELGRLGFSPPGAADSAQAKPSVGMDKGQYNNANSAGAPESLARRSEQTLAAAQRSCKNENETSGEIIDRHEPNVANEGANSNSHEVQSNEEKFHLARVSSNVSPEQARIITSNQLIEFVSACVPRNKRVLCLIVRDRVSKFNQAKSYFYAKYYLFIQAIVDIDDMLTANEHMANLTSYEDLTIGGTRSSADNSFSASSSISADMMFAGTDAESAALLSSSSAAAANKAAAASSYSDNEDESGSERLPTQTPEMNEQRAHCLKVQKQDTIVYPSLGSIDNKRARQRNSIPESLQNHLSSGYDINSDEDVGEDDSENEDANYQSDDQKNKRIDGAHDGENRIAANDLDANIIASLFDNDKNPYTGTFGVLLAGWKRKKGKT